MQVLHNLTLQQVHNHHCSCIFINIRQQTGQPRCSHVLQVSHKLHNFKDTVYWIHRHVYHHIYNLPWYMHFPNYSTSDSFLQWTSHFKPACIYWYIPTLSPWHLFLLKSTINFLKCTNLNLHIFSFFNPKEKNDIFQICHHRFCHKYTAQNQQPLQIHCSGVIFTRRMFRRNLHKYNVQE